MSRASSVHSEEVRPSVDEVVEGLEELRGYEGQIRAHEVFEAREGEFVDLELDPSLEEALAARGIDGLYRHQSDAISAYREGRNVVVSTETASGKSLVYTVPAVESALDGGRTLYVAPQKALLKDQLEKLRGVAVGAGLDEGEVAAYHGGLDKGTKRRIRDRRPSILLVTPDQLHASILQFHDRGTWGWLLDSLENMVVDEVHQFRGVFGSHFSLVMRRLNRVLGEHVDGEVGVICCSATISNPVGHASRVTGRDGCSFELVDGDASSRGEKHWLVWNPPRRDDGEGRKSSHPQSMNLFSFLLQEGMQSLVFTGSRQGAERYALGSENRLKGMGERGLAGRVAAYEGALKPGRRTEIEDGLRSGRLAGAWSTNALELGVDIGGLDAVVLDGYPGTLMETYQRAGRAGRGSEGSLVVLVPGNNQLDQYVAREPEELFEKEPEEARVNPGNETILEEHLVCAADEKPLTLGDAEFFGEEFLGLAEEMEGGRLVSRENGLGLKVWEAGEEDPQWNTDIRDIDRSVVELRGPGGVTVAELGAEAAIRDAHPGAIYTHQGEKYRVEELDLGRGVAELSSAERDLATYPLKEKSVEVAEVRDEEERSGYTARFGEIEVTEEVTGYAVFDPMKSEVLKEEDLDLEPLSMRTEAVFFDVPGKVLSRVEGEDGFMPALHAAEHALISMLPTEVVCDPRDVGGLSIDLHQATGGPGIFVHDAYTGGVGISEALFGRLGSLMERTSRAIGECPCDSGCPSCIYDPNCGNANEVLDKEGGREILRSLSEKDE